MANDIRIKHTSIAWTIISITLITGLVDIVMTEDFQIDQYLGCFYDGETQPGTQSRSPDISNVSLTIDICIQHCRTKGVWSYATLQNGTDCRCSNNYGGRQVQDSFCNIACGGNASHVCGGTYENGHSTYVLYAVCPIGTYGLMCNETCHCKSQVPCDRQTGRCPDGCHGNYTGAQCNQLTSLSEQYIGCYRDSIDDRAMEKRNDHSKNTLQYCLDLCSSNYSYAGPQFGGECWCGESYDKHGRIAEGACNSACPGNTRQKCGGGAALSVYGTCPTGNYGPKCAKVCNCEGRCHFKNGTCLNIGCKPGWTGNACNIRDCRNNNGSCASYETCIEVEPITSLTMSVCRCKSGYWRNQAWGNCTDIDECSEMPNICGSLAKSCNNTEGGYTCHCTNGNVVQNSACIPDATADNNADVNNVGIVVVAVVGWFLFLIAIIINIIMGILYMRERERHHDKSNAATTVSSSGIVPEINTIPDNSATNPEPEESAYARIGNKTADDNRVYDVLAMQTKNVAIRVKK